MKEELEVNIWQQVWEDLVKKVHPKWIIGQAYPVTFVAISTPMTEYKREQMIVPLLMVCKAWFNSNIWFVGIDEGNIGELNSFGYFKINDVWYPPNFDINQKVHTKEEFEAERISHLKQMEIESIKYREEERLKKAQIIKERSIKYRLLKFFYSLI